MPTKSMAQTLEHFSDGRAAVAFEEQRVSGNASKKFVKTIRIFDVAINREAEHDIIGRKAEDAFADTGFEPLDLFLSSTIAR